MRRAADRPAAERLRELSCDPTRHEALAVDLYFSDCWEDVMEIVGPGAATALKRYALLVFKPEAIPGRRMLPAIDWLREHRFTPVAFESFTHTRHTMIDLWQYLRWTSGMTNLIPLAGMMHTSTPTLLVILRDDTEGHPARACDRLVRLKGSAIAERRNRSHLREVLRPPAEIFTFVHSSDEPADVVREVGVCLDRGPRRRLLCRLVDSGAHGDVCGELRLEVARLEAGCAEHDLEFERSLRRVEATWPIDRDDRLRLETAGNGGPKLQWDELRAMIDPGAVDAWDFIAIGCAVLDL